LLNFKKKKKEMILYQEKKIEVGNLKMKIVKKKLHTHTHTLSLSLSLSLYVPKNKTKNKTLPSSPWRPLPRDHGQHRIK
jgi:hypothetical protein